MPKEPFTYADWLALDPSERIAILKTWNPYAGENIHIPKEAGRRLMQSSELRIRAVRVGIYHGGEYILNPELRPHDLKRAPAWLEQELEGFRVGYCKYDPSIPRPKDHG